MDQFFQANKEHWNAATPLHLGPGEIYDVDAFRNGALTLLPIERKALGDVAGKRILHAQCHIGVDSMSLARLGAKVTGVDFSEEAIRVARALNSECGLDCRFVCCNIYDLPSHLHEEFDTVFASYGVLCWLPDLERWCRILADRLRHDGEFVLVDGHPFSYCIQPGTGQAPVVVCRSYFSDGTPQFCPGDEEGDCDYHATQTPVGKATYEWTHTVSDVINAVAGAGLRIQSFDEHAEMCYRLHPDMTRGADGLFRWPDANSQYPLLFSLKAVKE
jgi:SAM-dependent methyltransferase